MTRLRVILGLTTCLILSLPTAVAASPSAGHPVDGQILYELNDPVVGDLIAYRLNPDGSGSQQVFDQPMECPHWSPNGTQIASCGAPDGNSTTIVNVDTGATRFLPSVTPNLTAPCYVWSSDGSRLACEGFNDNDPSHNGIFTVRVSDWGDAKRLTTNDGASDVPGDYSPNSKQLVFSRTSADTGDTALFRVNSNSTGLRRITPLSLPVGSSGSWSPRGNEILFSAHSDGNHRQSLWLVHSDGSGLRKLAIPGIPCGGAFADPTSIGCADPTWSPSGRQLDFRVNSPTDSGLWRAHADGTHPALVIDLGFDPGESVDWGTHPLSTGP